LVAIIGWGEEGKKNHREEGRPEPWGREREEKEERKEGPFTLQNEVNKGGV